MSEGIVVDLMPIALDKGADQQQQRRLGLVEIGHQHLDNLVVIAWGNDDLSTAMEHLHGSGIHPVGQCPQCLNTPYPILLTFAIIRLPLTDVELVF